MSPDPVSSSITRSECAIFVYGNDFSRYIVCVRVLSNKGRCLSFRNRGTHTHKLKKKLLQQQTLASETIVLFVTHHRLLLCLYIFAVVAVVVAAFFACDLHSLSLSCQHRVGAPNIGVCFGTGNKQAKRKA